MPKKKGFYINLPKFVTRDALDKIMFGFVLGYKYRGIIPIMLVKEAIMKFQEEFNLTDDEYPLDSAVVTFYNILKEYQEFVKS